MILPKYRVAASRIPGAGQGLFLEASVARGAVVIAPDAIARTWRWEELLQRPDAEALLPSTVRWFEDRYTVTPDWPDECYINHAFAPTGIWHLGFVFAARDLTPGTEITVDYRHLLAPGQCESFRDAESGREIIGLPWRESLVQTLAELQRALA
jgi:hypothetical protein